MGGVREMKGSKMSTKLLFLRSGSPAKFAICSVQLKGMWTSGCPKQPAQPGPFPDWRAKAKKWTKEVDSMMVKRTCPFILEVMSRCNELSPSLNCSSLLWSRRNQLSQVVSKFQSGAMSKQLGSGVRAEGLGWSRRFLPEPPEAVECQEGKPNVNPHSKFRFIYQREQVQKLSHTERRSQDGSCTLTESQTTAQGHDVKVYILADGGAEEHSHQYQGGTPNRGRVRMQAQLMGAGQTAFSLPVSPSMKCFDYRKRLAHGLRSLTILSGMISKVHYERSIATRVSHAPPRRFLSTASGTCNGLRVTTQLS